MRMYVADYITNIGGYHWNLPAKWMLLFIRRRLSNALLAVDLWYK